MGNFDPRLSESGKRVGTVEERQSMQNEINHMESMARNPQFGSISSNKKYLTELHGLKRKLNDMQPRTLSKSERDRLSDDMMKEREEYKKRVMSREEGREPNERNVSKHVNYIEKQNASAIGTSHGLTRDELFKSGLVALDPSNPESGNLDKFRKEYGSSGG